MLLGQLVADACGAHDGTALREGQRTWSFQDLDRITRVRASVVRDSAVGGRRVVLVGEHRAEAVLWALSVMRSGLIYTPLNSGFTRDEVLVAIELAEPDLVIVLDPDLADALRDELGAVVISADDLLDEAVVEDDGGPWASDEVAYSIFTSGSTGQAKLVDVGHRGIEALCRAQIERFPVRRGDSVLQFAALAFDASVAEVLVSLVAGAELVVPAWTAESWLGSVVAHLHAERIDVATLPASVYAALDETARAAIRTVVFAGEALSEDVWRTAAQHSRVLNAYGPSEGTVCFSIAEMADFSFSIGRAIPGYRALVDVDGALRTSGRGELLIVGSGVALGYAGGHPENARFSTIDGEPAYRTGDIVTVVDGEIDYVGRTDAQVKRLGHRLDLVQLESRIAAVLERRSVLVASDGALVLVLEGSGGAATDQATVLTRLRTSFASWELPDVVRVLDGPIPVTVNGKLDRARLSLPAGRGVGNAPSGHGDGGAHATDRPVTESAVARIAAEVLGRPLDVDTALFDAGGTSMTLVRLQSALARDFGQDAVRSTMARIAYDFSVRRFVSAHNGAIAEPVDEIGAALSDLDRFLDEVDEASRRGPSEASLRGREEDADDASAPTVLTGASGFIGGRVLNRLLSAGRRVIVATTSPTADLLERHGRRFGRPREDYEDVVVLDTAELADSPERWDAVLHCGYDVNHLLPLRSHMLGSVTWTKDLVRLALEHGASSFVFASSSSVGDVFAPLSRETLTRIPDGYSRSKAVAERVVEAFRPRSGAGRVLRLGLVYGHSEAERESLELDTFASLLVASQRLDAVPRLTGTIPVVDVESVVDAVVSGDALHQQVIDRTYTLAEVFRAFGLRDPVELDPQDWMDEAVARADLDERVLPAVRALLGEVGGWDRTVDGGPSDHFTRLSTTLIGAPVRVC